MNKYKLLLIQVGIIPYCTIMNRIISRNFDPFDSFTISLQFYWLYILFSSILLLRNDAKVQENFMSLFKKTRLSGISLIAFIPLILIIPVAFIPILNDLSVKIVLSALIIGIFNGFIEEAFWRGLAIAGSSNSKLLIISTILFGLYHFTYLQLHISFQGGAANLVGGSLLMGIIWVFVSTKTNSIRSSIISHQMVNILAFSSMYALNRM